MKSNWSSLHGKYLSNCFLFALGCYWREGGYLIASKSRWGWWLHFQWSPDLDTIWEFHPLRVKRPSRRFPPLVFWGEGRIVEQD